MKEQKNLTIKRRIYTLINPFVILGEKKIKWFGLELRDIWLQDTLTSHYSRKGYYDEKASEISGQMIFSFFRFYLKIWWTRDWD